MRNVLYLFVGLLICSPINQAVAAPHPASFFNGFEESGDVGDADQMITVTRVPSGTAGVSSAAGDWHAQAAPTDFGSPDGFVFTRYGGYNNDFPNGGYTTSVDVYLDTAKSTIGDDLRFDWSSAINNTAGDHRRDFIFHVGTDTAGNYVISVSNNAPGWPANPARDPLYLSDHGLGTGWYTLEHNFYNDGGVLAVDLSVIDMSGVVLKTWTLSDPSDEISVAVGGNRYGWLVTNEFSVLELDNVTRSGAPTPQAKSDCKKGGWEDLFRSDGTTFKNQGDCVQYVNTGK